MIPLKNEKEVASLYGYTIQLLWFKLNEQIIIFWIVVQSIHSFIPHIMSNLLNIYLQKKKLHCGVLFLKFNPQKHYVIYKM